ncbi:hypothetical protein [Paenibacillus kobensis]|uniref:hypothetical protein n=1 Tax=Paenibacillus kobensis TaxID=59841 RepID=UPI000FDB3F86|nr:hypothetical protein [Paenibacillus kobensis]
MSLMMEVDSIAREIETLYPEANVYRLEEPEGPAPGAFVIGLMEERRMSEARDHTLVERKYAVIRYGANARQTLLDMEALSRHLLNERLAIPIGDSARVMRIESFSYASPVKAENGTDVCSGFIQTLSREPRIEPVVEKIGKVNIRTQGMQDYLKGRDM